MKEVKAVGGLSGGQLAAQEPTEPHGEGKGCHHHHHHGGEGEVGEVLGLELDKTKKEEQVDGIKEEAATKQGEQGRTGDKILEKMKGEVKNKNEGKKTPSRRKKKPTLKEILAEKEQKKQEEKMRNMLKTWSEKAKTVKTGEVVECRKEPVEKLSLVESRKRRFSQVQEEVNSFEQWKRRKEEQRKHKNMTMENVKEKVEGVLDSGDRVVITDREKGKPEKLKNITSCNLGEGLDQVQHGQALAGGGHGEHVGKENLLAFTRRGEKRAGMGESEKAEKAAASLTSMGEISVKRKLGS